MSMKGAAELADIVNSSKVLEFPRAARPTAINLPGNEQIGIEASTVDGKRKKFVFYRNCIVGNPYSASGQETALQYLMALKEFLNVDARYGPAAGVTGPSVTRGLYVEAGVISTIDNMLERGIPAADSICRYDPARYESLRAQFVTHFPELNTTQPF